jgi:hypothetical protein
MAKERVQVNDEEPVDGTDTPPPADTSTEQSTGPQISDKPGTDTVAAKPAEDEPRIPMMFPRDVYLQHGGLMHHFKKGVQKVRASLADHPWLKDNGVIKFND